MIWKKSACEFIHDFFNLYKVFAKYVKVIMHMHIYQFLEYILKFYACTNASLVFMLILTIKKNPTYQTHYSLFRCCLGLPLVLGYSRRV